MEPDRRSYSFFKEVTIFIEIDANEVKIPLERANISTSKKKTAA